jgi:integrase
MAGRSNIGRVSGNQSDFGCHQGWTASRISFFSWWNKENRVLIFPIHLDMSTAISFVSMIPKGKHAITETRPHWVYLTDTARALLPLPECSATNIQAWLKRKLTAAEIIDRFTPHVCRRTFATLANENGAEPFIVERALNHKMQRVKSVYNHAEYVDERIECARVVESAILQILK